MSLNKSQKVGIAVVGSFVIFAVSLMIMDLGIGWSLGAAAVFITLCAIFGKAGSKR